MKRAVPWGRAGRRARSLQRRLAWSGVVTVIAMLLSMFPQVVGAPLPTASAHNLQTRMVYMFFDPDAQACLDARIEGTTLPAGCAPLPVGWQVGDPLIQVGDELGVIIKVVPRDGTTTGVGGHIDFYVPNGVQVVDVGYVVPDGAGDYEKVAMKGQSPIAVGAGPIGAKATAQLVGLNDVYASTASGLSSTAVNPATGLHLGTIAGVYGDTGIFYATDPDTAYGSWQRFTGDWNTVDPYANRCGSLAFAAANGETIVNNSGDTVVPCNKWDAGQLMAWGAKGGTYGQSAPIVDYADGRGNAPWGFASGVAGPESGYAWHFDWNEWNASAKNDVAMRAAMSNDSIGPWQRIQYNGDRVSNDQPGLLSTVLGYANKDAGDLGVPVSSLPTTLSQTDGTSPKAIRWAVGQLTAYRPEYAWVKVRVDNAAAGITNASGCPELRGDTFGGDAGGTDNGKDHLWRYYEPTEVRMNLCAAAGKPATAELVKSGTVFQYPVKIYNLQDFPLTNVVVRDTLGSGLTFLSAVPAQNSGPNPLVWNVGTLLPGQKFEALVTVRAGSSGYLDNCIEMSSSELPTQNACDSTISGLYPYLVPSKTARTTGLAAGGTVIYDVLVKNTGTGPTGSPVTIREFLPPGFTYDASFTPVVTVNGALVAPAVSATNPNEPVFTVPAAIQAGQQLTIAFQAQVDPAAEPGLYCNSYSVTQNGVPITTGSEACVRVAGGKIGDTVWRDWDGDGVQDPAEEGIAGATVKLYASDGTTLLATTTTDANGHYYFPGLVAGTYVVEVNNGLPFLATTPTGDPDGVFDNRHTVVLAEDEQYLTADFGYQPGGPGGYGDIDNKGGIGDRVFEDVGNDGVFTPGVDTGIPGVTVYLYEDSDGDGVIDPATDALVRTRVTDANGVYGFTFLGEKYDYIAYVDPADAALAAYFGVDPYQASTLNPHPVDNLIGVYLDADFGFWRVEPGSIGDQVFMDNNGDGLYDAGDTPLAGVTVNLYRDGNLIATTTSGPDGTYLFDTLGPGDYTVVVDTADPDLPGGLFAVVSQYEKTLTPGENYLDADFPFVNGLTKTVDKSFVDPAGSLAERTLTFSLKPYYPGNNLLENVRIIDPLPTGTTYVVASANAGGTYGAYTPIVAVPGQDIGGGPAGTTTLDTAFTVSANFVNTGGSVNVTMNVKQNSGSTVNNVSPDPLGIDGGSASCTGPTPATANVPTGATGSNFVWACTLSQPGEYIFSGSAENDLATYTWPGASSASVLAAPDGGPNVVTWSLGSNVAGVPGETLTSGYTAGVYAFRGGNTKEFSKYGVSAGTWTSKAQPTNGIEKGGSLTGDGAGTLYALEGNSKVFYKYTISTNTWSPASGAGSLAQTSDNANEGGSVQYLNVSGTQYVFALLGNSNRFRRYNVATNTWTSMASTPASVKKGGALTTDGTYLYAFRGDRKTDFWRCNATTTGSAGSCDTSWTARAPAPGTVGWGGALTRIGNTIYALGGNGTTNFWSYDITANTWSAMASAPGAVDEGGALTTDGAYIYALQGKTKTYWRYNPATNAWTSLASVNFTGTVGQGGALFYDPGLTPVGRFTSMTASPSLVSTGHQITIRLTLQSSTAVNNVVADTLNTTPTGGASCTSTSGPTLVSADDDIADANDSVIYQWVCTVAAGTSPGSLTFSAGGTGDGPTTFPSAQSRKVLVSPVLTFQATVNTSGAPVVIENTGLMVETSGSFGSLTSNTTETATAATIGDFVWADLNGDGVQDAGEPGLAGVEVCVYESDGVTLVACDTTDANGEYRIYGLTPADYVVRADPATYPAGYLPTTATSLDVTLTSGEQYNDADFGLKPPGTGRVGDYIWLDANSDGVQDGDELGLPGITVTLEINVGGVWAPVATTTTDANGGYAFTGLNAGDYRVTVDPNSPVTSPYGPTSTLGAAMAPTYDKDGGIVTPDGVTLVTLATDATVVDDVDFGYNWSGAIGDFVWWDYDTDGAQDEVPLAGIPNAAVLLYFDANGDGILNPAEGDYQVGFAMTDGNGAYTFENLPPGPYFVDVYEDSITTDGVRNIVPTTGNVLYKNLAAGETYPDADFGYYEGALVQGYVFHDDDRNGLFETTESGLAGITVTLNGTDMFGAPVSQTTTTDADGYFVFIVPEGDYTLTYNTAQTTAAGYPDATTVTSFAFHAYPGENWYEQTEFDFGVDYSGQIGDIVWNDINNNSALDAGEPGLSGVTVTLYEDNDDSGTFSTGDTFVAAQTTGSSGAYLFEGLADGNYVVVVNPATVPENFMQTYDNAGSLDHTGQGTITGGAADLTVDFGYWYDGSGTGKGVYTISGYVWEDTDGNGVFDGAELPIPGVRVTLACGAYGTYVLTTTSGGISGNYVLDNVPDETTCTISVDPSTLPSAAFAQTGDPDVTSPPACTGTACDNRTVVTLAGASVSEQNFGYRELFGSISGSVCATVDGDGACEAGEDALAGVTVALTWFGPDGILGTPDDAVITTTTTITGFYAFTDLPPGTYQSLESNPPNYTSVADADGGNPDVISPVSLPVGGAITARDFEDAPPPSVDITKVLTAPLGGVAAVSDTITFTIRITNTGITALPTLTITDTYDAAVLTLTSHSIVPNATGAGVITWSSNLASLLPLAPGAALTLTVDFHADASTLPGVTENVAGVFGADELGAPLPLETAADDVQIIAPEITVVKAGPAIKYVGETATYTYTVTNTGNVPLSNVTVADNKCTPVAPVLAGGFNQGDLNSDNLLDLPEAWRFTCSYVLRASDLGLLVNTATARGVSPLGAEVSDTDAWTTQVFYPTGVALFNFIARPSGVSVALSWEVMLLAGGEALEFHLWRATLDGAWKRITTAPITAASYNGVTYLYRYTDSVAERSVIYLYRLEAGDGAVYGPWQVTGPDGRYRSYLPHLRR